MKPLKFKVVTGYGKDDFIGIEQEEYSRAVRAQVKKTVFLSGIYGSLSGSEIKRVEPDLRDEKVYNPSGEDFVPSGRLAEYNAFMEWANANIERQIQGLPMLPQGQGGEIKQIGN